jgi:drug/metabolite transporter (DMT)-like permease
MWILSEAPSALQLLGVVFIIAGLLLATVRMRTPRVPEVQPEPG